MSDKNPKTPLEQQAYRLASWLKSGSCKEIEGEAMYLDILEWLTSNGAQPLPPKIAITMPKPWQDRYMRVACSYNTRQGAIEEQNKQADARDAELDELREILQKIQSQAATAVDDPRITAFYKLRDIAERDGDVESANVIQSAISQLHSLREKNYPGA